jgi:nucleotide-binding universal stress UspA family protein
MLMNHTPADIHVLTVIEPMPALFPMVEGMIITPEVDKSREEAQCAIVRDQLKLYDSSASWTLDSSIGRPAEAIVSYAHEHKADLIILGMNKHGILGRMLGEETASEVARLSSTPILIAAPKMRRLPTRVIIGMALNHGGMTAAGKAVRMTADSPSISCVHVKPRSEFLGIDWAEFDSEYEAAMRDRFNELQSGLEREGLHGELVVLHGDPAREVADFSAYSKAELVVAGVRHHRGRARATGGRMASRVMRSVSCSVLVVPDFVDR